MTPGPAPKHPSRRARRNNLTTGFERLPSSGRSGKVPPWPLEPNVELTAQAEAAQDRVREIEAELAAGATGRQLGNLRRQLDQARLREAVATARWDRESELELELWNQLWSTPQATMWESSTAYARMLAQFVRWNVKAEQGDLDAAREARIRGREFGLTPLTLMGLRAEIQRANDAEVRGERRRASQPAGPAAGAQSKPSDPRAELYVVKDGH